MAVRCRFAWIGARMEALPHPRNVAAAARYTARVMLRRLVPLVMVLTIALCPVALDVCQVACAEQEHGTLVTSSSDGHHHDAQPADAMAAHQHGHDAAPVAPAPATASATAMRGVPHGCLHGADLPAFVGTNLQIELPPAAAVPILFALPALTSGTRLAAATDSVVHSPPITLTRQLRV